jgi:ribosomal protein RSM22 (predicted rRNA methylase)
VQQPVKQASERQLEAVPEAWVQRVNAIALAHFGQADLKGAALGHAVADVSRVYTSARMELVKGRVRTAELVARLKWFSIRDLPKIEVPLTELSIRNALPAGPTWRVLDIGAGVGTSSLGVARFARRVGVEQLEVRAFDRDDQALRVFEALARDVTALDAVPIEPITTTSDVTRVPHALRDQRFELIVVGFVINELWPDASDEQRVEQASQWLKALSRHLTDDGSLIVLEPALREQTRQLQRVRDELALNQAAPYVFAPCTRSGPCPMLVNERDWCHAQVPFKLPASMAELARTAGLRDHDLTFSYLTLRKQPGRVGSDLRVVSSPLSSKGKVELIVCGEQGLSRAVRLDRHGSVENAAFDALGRGALARLPAPSEGGRIAVGEGDEVATIAHWTFADAGRDR